MRYHFTATGMVRIKENSNCGRGCGEIKTLIYRWWEYKIVQPHWKIVWQLIPQMAKCRATVAPNDSTHVYTYTYVDTYVHINLYTNVHSSIIYNRQKLETI